jgi:hypothetical protein
MKKLLSEQPPFTMGDNNGNLNADGVDGQHSNVFKGIAKGWTTTTLHVDGGGVGVSSSTTANLLINNTTGNTGLWYNPERDYVSCKGNCIWCYEYSCPNHASKRMPIIYHSPNFTGIAYAQNNNTGDQQMKTLWNVVVVSVDEKIIVDVKKVAENQDEAKFLAEVDTEIRKAGLTPKDVTVICNSLGQVKVKKEIQEVKIIKEGKE